MNSFKTYQNHPSRRIVTALALLISMNGLQACSKLSDSATKAAVAAASAKTLPAVQLTAPESGSFINATNDSPEFAISGTCLIERGTIQIYVDQLQAELPVFGTCKAGVWNATFDSTVLGVGNHTLAVALVPPGKVNGKIPLPYPTPNSAPTAEVNISGISLSNDVVVTKSLKVPTVVINTPSAGLYINALTDAATYTLTGTCSELSQTVGLKIDDVAQDEALGGLCVGGQWSKTFDSSALSEAVHTFSAGIQDTAGNPGISNALVITRDIHAPSVSLSAPLANSYINLISNSASFVVSGSCSEASRSVSLKVDGQAAVSFSGGSCNGTVFTGSLNTLGLTVGSHYLTAALTDAAGNITQSQSVNVIKDLRLPTVAITSPATSTYINAASDSASFALAGTCSETSQAVTYFVDGVASTNPSGGFCNGTSWSGTLRTTTLSAGLHSFTARVQSEAGNTGISTPAIVLTRDVLSPVVTIVNPANGSFINATTTSTSFAVNGSCNEASPTVTVKIDGASITTTSCASSTWSTSVNTNGLSQGAHTFSLAVVDLAGNPTAGSNSPVVTKDTVYPSIAFSTPANLSYINVSNDSASFALTGTCDQASQAVSVKLDGVVKDAGGTCAGGTNWSAAINTTSGVSEALHTLSAYMSDAAGNSTFAVRSLTRDISAPVLDITRPVTNTYIHAYNDSASFIVTGNCSGSSTSITVKVDGASAASQAAVNCSGSSWTSTIDTTGVAEGVHTLTSAATDVAANVGSSSGITFTKDMTKPGVPTFVRASTAYNATTGASAVSGAARYINKSGATGILIENGVTNLMNGNASAFVVTTSGGWLTFSSSAVTISAGQTDPFGSTDAYRIQGVGGSSVLKSLAGYAPGTNGLPYSGQIWVKNRDASPVLVFSNQGSLGVWVTQAEGWKLVKLENITSNGAGVLQIQLRTTNVGDTLDIDAMNPMYEQRSYATSYTAPAYVRADESLTVPVSGSLNHVQGAVVVRAYIDGDLLSASSTTQRFLFDFAPSGGSSNNRMSLWANGSGSFRAQTNNASAQVSSAVSANTLSAGWHTFGMRWSTSELALWIDGSKVATAANPYMPSASATVFNVGSANVTGFSWGHPIDAFTTYQYAPTDAQMDTFSGALGPSLYDNRLDFNGLSFSRPSIAFNPNSGAQSSLGTPRFVTQSGATGLLIEEATTNYYNYDFETLPVALGSDSGLSTNLLSTDYAFFGTKSLKYTSASTNYNIYHNGGGTFTSAGASTYTSSFYLKRADGVTPSFVNNYLYHSVTGNSYPAASGTAVAGGWNRYSASQTYASAGGISLMGFQQVVPANTMSYTDGWQVEAKKYATSYITGGTSRSAESLTVPTNQFLSTVSGKIRLRFLSQRNPGVDYQSLLDLGGTGVNGFYLGITSGGKVELNVGDGSTLPYVQSTTTVVKNTWYTIEAIWSGTAITLKVNGTQEATQAITPAITWNANGYIGSYGGSSRHLDGVLDWLELENSAAAVTRWDFNSSLGQ